jgi:acetyl esterase/lipase
VLFFVHGGAWRTGDRSHYLPLGNRFASEGLLVVAPSYRLAPKNPFPAQIVDVAAAFAWTVKHIKEHGGDPERIYVAGHSAGGHLVSLLTLDPSHLEKHNLSPKLIRGTAALSGVYDLTAIGDSQAAVFGTDKEFRRKASPLSYVNDAAPPFLVTYCQWDYMTLPAQAKSFHAALKKVGVTSELVFVPRENHISEMLSIANPDDVTAKSILKFVK